MAKLALKSLQSGFLSISEMNQNFTDIEAEFQDKVLYRDNPISEPNAMQNALDMNSKRILNLPSPINDSDAARFGDIKNALAVELVSIPALLNNEQKVLSTDGTALVFKAGVLTVNDFSELTIIAKAKLQTNDVIQVMGRATIADGGEGTFRFDAASTAIANGGTVLATDEGGAAGRWLRVHVGAVNVKWFGAVGDGIANDTVPIQAAIATLLNVFAPIGTYLVDNLTSAGPNQRLFGEGWDSIFKHNVTVGNLLDVTDAFWSVERLRFDGDGTFNQSAAVPNNDRRSLVKVTGNDFTSENVRYHNGPQNALALDSMLRATINFNQFTGGVSSLTDTAYQGLRVTDCSDVVVKGSYFPGGVNKYVIGIQFATFGGLSANNQVIYNTMKGTFDNSIYMINSEGCLAAHNITISDSTGIVMVGTSSVGGRKAGNTVINNICLASATLAAADTVGIFARDANNSIFDHNHVFGFPTSMQMAPVQHNDALNSMSYNSMSHNVLIGWTTAAIKHTKSTLNLGDTSHNKFNHNIMFPGILTTASVAINAVISQQASADIAFFNEYNHNDIDGSGNIAISLSGQQDYAADYNDILNGVIAGASTKTFIFAPSCTRGSISYNKLTDTVGGVASSAIDGNNTCIKTDVHNNRIKGSFTSAKIRRMQQAGKQNSTLGNRTGDDALHGTVTLSALAATVVANDNINFGFGYTSFVLLQAINITAGTLIGGVKSPIIDESDHTNLTDFTIKTANNAAAAGSEQFYYEIRQ